MFKVNSKDTRTSVNICVQAYEELRQIFKRENFSKLVTEKKKLILHNQQSPGYTSIYNALTINTDKKKRFFRSAIQV